MDPMEDDNKLSSDWRKDLCACSASSLGCSECRNSGPGDIGLAKKGCELIKGVRTRYAVTHLHTKPGQQQIGVVFRELYTKIMALKEHEVVIAVIDRCNSLAKSFVSRFLLFLMEQDPGKFSVIQHPSIRGVYRVSDNIPPSVIRFASYGLCSAGQFSDPIKPYAMVVLHTDDQYLLPHTTVQLREFAGVGK